MLQNFHRTFGLPLETYLPDHTNHYRKCTDGHWGTLEYDQEILQSQTADIPMGPPGVLESWGEWLFVFRELGSTGNYFQGFWEQAHSFGDLGVGGGGG